MILPQNERLKSLNLANSLLTCLLQEASSVLSNAYYIMKFQKLPHSTEEINKLYTPERLSQHVQYEDYGLDDFLRGDRTSF